MTSPSIPRIPRPTTRARTNASRRCSSASPWRVSRFSPHSRLWLSPRPPTTRPRAVSSERATARALAFVGLAAGPSGATADTSPTDPQQQQALIDQIRAQLGSNLADALAAQQQLKTSLQDNAAQQQAVQAKIAEVQKKIADLDVQIADAQRREAILAHRIDAERKQLRQLARAIYTAPTSVLVVLGEAQSLSDLLTRIADLNVAGARATELKGTLALDLNQRQAEREKEQAARDEQIKQREQLDSQLSQLKALQAQQEQSMADLQVKINQTQTELYLLSRQSAQLAQQVTDMLQQ